MIKHKRPNADTLTISSIVASILLGNSTSALTIILLSDIAEFMTSYTMKKTRDSIKHMIDLMKNLFGNKMKMAQLNVYQLKMLK